MKRGSKYQSGNQWRKYTRRLARSGVINGIAKRNVAAWRHQAKRGINREKHYKLMA